MCLCARCSLETRANLELPLASCLGYSIRSVYIQFPRSKALFIAMNEVRTISHCSHPDQTTHSSMQVTLLAVRALSTLLGFTSLLICVGAAVSFLHCYLPALLPPRIHLRSRRRCALPPTPCLSHHPDFPWHHVSVRRSRGGRRGPDRDERIDHTEYREQGT